MERIVIRIGYKKFLQGNYDRVDFEILYRDYDDMLEYYDGATFCLGGGRPDDNFVTGHKWSEDLDRLEVAAQACAFFNGRKNVIDTTPDEGVLY